jgi:hypothetical protein
LLSVIYFLKESDMIPVRSAIAGERRICGTRINGVQNKTRKEFEQHDRRSGEPPRKNRQAWGLLTVVNNEIDNTVLYVSASSTSYTHITSSNSSSVLIHTDADKISDLLGLWANTLFYVRISGEDLRISGLGSDNSFFLTRATWESIINTGDNAELYPNGYKISGTITSKEGTG